MSLSLSPILSAYTTVAKAPLSNASTPTTQVNLQQYHIISAYEPQFAPFSRLPPELRLQIWRESFPRGRVVSLDLREYFIDKDPKQPSKSSRQCQKIRPHTAYVQAYDLDNLAEVPVSLHVCSESRQEALRYYKVIARPENYWDKTHGQKRRFPFTFNPLLDVAFLGNTHARWAMSAEGLLKGCGLLLGNLSRHPDCCTFYLQEGFSCGDWMSLLEKYAPGLLASIRNVHVKNIEWSSTAKRLMEAQIFHLSQTGQYLTPNPKGLIFGPLIHMKAMEQLTMTINSNTCYFSNLVATLRELLQVHNVHPVEVQCIIKDPGTGPERIDRLLEALKVPALKSIQEGVETAKLAKTLWGEQSESNVAKSEIKEALQRRRQRRRYPTGF